MKRYKVLLSNDDGIQSYGLQTLLRELIANENPKYDVNVFAPAIQQTASSKSMTFNQPVRVYQKKVIEGFMGTAVEGTPADAVIIGIYEHDDIDFVISGINAGDNTSIHSILSSGTLAVCFEASIDFDLQGWAFSLETDSKHFFSSSKDNNLPQFKVAAHRAVEIINKTMMDQELPEEVSFINVNFPSEINRTTPIRITTPALRKHTNYPVERKDPRNTSYYWIWGNPIETIEGTDDFCIKKTKEISFTPISIKKIGVVEERDINYFRRIFSYK